MATLKLKIKTNFTKFRNFLLEELQSSSVTAELIHSHEVIKGDTTVSFDTFERFSYTGSNRVCMSVVMVTDNGLDIDLVASTAGGSQAMFLKINTWGEESFLDKLREAVNTYAGKNII